MATLAFYVPRPPRFAAVPEPLASLALPPNLFQAVVATGRVLHGSRGIVPSRHTPMTRTPILLVATTAWLLVAPASRAGESEAPTPPPPVVATARALSVVPDLSRAAPAAAGRRVWNETVELPGASFVKLHLVDLNLRAGDRLLVIAADGRVVDELEGRGPGGRGSFWTLSAPGDRVTLELEVGHRYGGPPFRVDQGLAGDPAMLDPAPPDGPRSVCFPADFEDVVCYQGDAGKWANVLASVGVMTVGSHPDNPSPNGLWCSGSNVSPRNMLLTNQHCIGTQAQCDDAELVFRYYRTGCNDGSATTTGWKSFRCGQLVASSPFVSCDQGLGDLDFSLNTVIGDPAATFGWVRPDPTPLTDGEALYIVQHPAGRPHEITHGSGSDVDVDGTVLRYYGTLDTDGGSSGSPIFREADDRLVGLHHCGGCSSPGIGNRGMLMRDIQPLIAGFLCSPAVDLRGVGATGLVQVTGDGDAVIEPGETWRVTPEVLDAACDEDGLAVTATVAAGAGSEPVALAAPAVGFGTVPAGQRRPATGPVAFEVSTAAACGGEVVLDLTDLAASNGGPFADTPGLLRREIGETVWTTLAFSDFHLGVPASWTVVDGGTGSGAARTWTTANPGGRTLPLGAPFAIADSRALGAQTMDEQLVSPAVATGGFAVVELQFRHQFRWFSGGLDEKADVDVRSAATAGSWVNVARFSGAPASGLATIDLTPYSAADLQVRFRYHDAINEYWWAVDDVYLRGGVPECEVFEGLFADGFESGNTSAWSATVP